jgi:serine/threonine protein kinase
VEEDRTVFQRSPARSMRPGTRLNNVYEIERLVAQGGMGEVYRGFNIQTGDPVAIKMIRPEFANDPEIFDLFRRDASILHSFTHDAIVRYFVFSVDPQLERAYLAMEFVEGPSLKKRLGSGPLPLAEVRILQKRVASAL